MHALLHHRSHLWGFTKTAFVLTQGWREHKTPFNERKTACDELQFVEWMSAEMRTRSYDLCVQATLFSTVSFIRDPNSTTVDKYGIWEDTIPETWSTWIEADLKHPEFAMWPLYQYTSEPRNQPALQ